MEEQTGEKQENDEKREKLVQSLGDVAPFEETTTTVSLQIEEPPQIIPKQQKVEEALLFGTNGCCFAFTAFVGCIFFVVIMSALVGDYYWKKLKK
jgi:hypothetical protein